MSKYRELPSISSVLVKIDPIEVQPTDLFKQAKSALSELGFQTEGLRKEINSDSELREAGELVSKLKRFRAELQGGTQPTLEAISKGLAQVSGLEAQLQTPASELLASLSAQMRAYIERRDQAQVEADRKASEKAEAQSKASQWQQGILTLRSELASARQVADNAERAGEMETAKEIRRGLQRFNALDTQPNSFTEPLKDARIIRQVVAQAMQNELSRS